MIFLLLEKAAAAEPARDPAKLIHVAVALCDNKFQGIVPSLKGSATATIPRTT